MTLKKSKPSPPINRRDFMSNIRYTTINESLCAAVAELVKICFPEMPESDQYTEADLLEMAKLFPAGTIVVLDGEKVIGMGTGIFTDLDFDNLPTTEHAILYDDVKDESVHSDDGDYYYGSDLAVHPDYRGRGLARQIYNRRKALVTDGNKKGFAAAAVLPGYMDHKDKLDIDTYLDKVKSGELFDPTLSVQLRNGFRAIRPLKDFFIYPKSDNWSVLILWENPDYHD